MPSKQSRHPGKESKLEPFISQFLVKGITLNVMYVGCGIWLPVRTPSNTHSSLWYFRSDKPMLWPMTRSKTSSGNHQSRIKTPMSFKARGLKRRAERCWVSGVRCGAVRCGVGSVALAGKAAPRDGTLSLASPPRPKTGARNSGYKLHSQTALITVPGA